MVTPTPTTARDIANLTNLQRGVCQRNKRLKREQDGSYDDRERATVRT